MNNGRKPEQVVQVNDVAPDNRAMTVDARQVSTDCLQDGMGLFHARMWIDENAFLVVAVGHKIWPAKGICE